MGKVVLLRSVSKMKNKKAFTIIEVLIAIFVVVSGFLVLLSVMGASLRYATQSRNRISANVIAESLIEKMSAHHYGAPEPSYWAEPEYTRALIEGSSNVLTTRFDKKIEFENGSFIGKSNLNYDKATITITWREGTSSVEKDRNKQLIYNVEFSKDEPEL